MSENRYPGIPTTRIAIDPRALITAIRDANARTTKVGWSYHALSERGDGASVSYFLRTVQETQKPYFGKKKEVCINGRASKRANAITHGEHKHPTVSCVFIVLPTLVKVLHGDAPVTSRVGYFYDSENNRQGNLFVSTDRETREILWNGKFISLNLRYFVNANEAEDGDGLNLEGLEMEPTNPEPAKSDEDTLPEHPPTEAQPGPEDVDLSSVF